MVWIEQEFGASEPAGVHQLVCRDKKHGMICWVLVSGHILPLTWTKGSPNLYHSIADTNVKASGLIVDISQDNFVVCKECCVVELNVQFL